MDVNSIHLQLCVRHSPLVLFSHAHGLIRNHSTKLICCVKYYHIAWLSYIA